MTTPLSKFMKATKPFISLSLDGVDAATKKRICDVRQQITIAVAQGDNWQFDTLLGEYVELWKGVADGQASRSCQDTGAVPEFAE